MARACPYQRRRVQARAGLAIAATCAGSRAGALQGPALLLAALFWLSFVAIVTGLLVGVYAGLVLLATHVLSVSSPVAVAGSTLAAAALFNPVRRLVQQRVDRRFNRARYDADKTVAMFAGQLRDAVDLDAVRGDLATVVHQALEPTHVSAWIAGSHPARS